MQMLIATLNSQKMKKNMNVSQLIKDKHTVFCPLNGILLGNKKEDSTGLYYDMDKSWKYHNEWKEPDTKCHTLWVQSYEMSRIDTPIDKIYHT